METYDVVIVGAGVSGIAAAHYLLKQNPHLKLRILEKGAGVGGTWLWNYYPGAACDVPSHWYSFSFAQNPNWTRRFSNQEEIRGYLEGVCSTEGLTPLISLSTTVTSTVWNEEFGGYEVSVQGSDSGIGGGSSSSSGSSGKKRVLRARYLVAGVGALSSACMPSIKGLESFKGEVFHSAQWDNGVSLEGKRVGVIGTGCSGAQIVPAIAPKVGSMVVFQRTPAWVAPRGDHGYSPWTRFLFAVIPGLMWLYRMYLMVLHDVRYFAFVRPLHPALQRMAVGFSTRHLEAQVSDLTLRKALTPNYAYGCKRVVISDDFYPALSRPNVTLETAPISSITPRGVSVRVEGGEGKTTTTTTEHPLDVIVLATGFDVVASMDSLNVTGRGGVRMRDALKSTGVGTPDAYLGITAPHYPSLFFMMGPNTGLGHSSMITMIEAQARYAAEAITGAMSKGFHSLEVKEEVCDAYNKGIQRELLKNVWGGCSSWYNQQGVKNIVLWPFTTLRYHWETRKVKWENFKHSA